MRTFATLVLALMAVTAALGAAPAGLELPGQPPDQVVQASVQEPPKADIDIDVDKGASRRDGEWFLHPTTIGLGILALLVIVVLFAFLNRGGGTTVVNP